MHFIEIFVVETKPFVGSFIHVIMTRQTCGQRSSRAAESKRRAIGNYFPDRFCYMFLISKCRGDRVLFLFSSSLLSFGKPQRNGKIRFFLRQNTFFPGFCHCAAILQTQAPKLCTNLGLGLLYILILGTNSKFDRENYRSAFAFRSSARAQATGLPHQDHVYKTTDETIRFHNKIFDEIHCKLDSTENPRSFEQYPTVGQPHLKESAVTY